MSSAAPPTVRALRTVAVVHRFDLGLGGGCLSGALDSGYGGSGVITHCRGCVDEGGVAGVRRESGLVGFAGRPSKSLALLYIFSSPVARNVMRSIYSRSIPFRNRAASTSSGDGPLL
jgi:hypothetical protein